MKQSLALRVGQSLTMTPALQQAIRLLQLSSLDLQQEIQSALESNVMLEVDEPEAETPIEEAAIAAVASDLPAAATTATAEEEARTRDEELPVELGWGSAAGYETRGGAAR